MTLTDALVKTSPFSWISGISNWARGLIHQNNPAKPNSSSIESPSIKSNSLELALHSTENPLVRNVLIHIAAYDRLGNGTISLEQAMDMIDLSKSSRTVAKLLNYVPSATAYGSGDSKGLYHAGVLHAELVFGIRSMSIGTSAGGYAAANAAKLKHNLPLNGTPLSLELAQQKALELYDIIRTQSSSFPGSVTLDRVLGSLEHASFSPVASFGKSAKAIRGTAGELYQAVRLIRSKGALRDDQPLKEFLASFPGDEPIGDYHGFHTVYTDYRSPQQRQVVHWDRHPDMPMNEVLYRTMAAPPLFAPKRTEHSIMADGGIVEPVPIRTAYEDCGARIVIAVPLQCYIPISDFKHEGISGVFYHIGRVFNAAMRERTIVDIERFSRTSFDYMQKVGCSPIGNMILIAPDIQGKENHPFLLNDPRKIIEQGSYDTIQRLAKVLSPRFAPPSRASIDYFMKKFELITNTAPPVQHQRLALPYLSN